MQKKVFLLITIFYCSLGMIEVKAQRYKFPDEPNAFIGTVKKVLTDTKRQPSIKAGEAFSSVWNSKLSSSQKSTIIKLSQKMDKEKRATAAKQFTDFFASIANAISNSKVTSTQIDDYLKVTGKILDAVGTRDHILYFKRMNNFFWRKAINNGKRNRLYANGGSFKISYYEAPDQTLGRQYAVKDSSGNPQETLVEGAIIEFTGIDLVIATPFDSLAVRKTSGLFDVLKHDFIGKGGKFDWTSVNLDPSSVFCEMDTYRMRASKPVLNANNVLFTYKGMLNLPIRGNFEFASKNRKGPQYAQYPKFTSYNSTNNIAFEHGVTYHGGFTLEGLNIYSNSVDPLGFSEIVGKKDGETRFRVISHRFNLTDTLTTFDRKRKERVRLPQISAKKSSFALYLGGGEDSLFHPDLQFRLLKGDTAEVFFVRDNNRSSRLTPFTNNHHDFYTDADIVKYHIKTDSLDFFRASGADVKLQPVVFESFDYFNLTRYNDMMSVYNFHPLKLFSTYASDSGLEEFYIDEIASHTKRNPGILKSVAQDLKARGYINYDADIGLVKMEKRIYQTDSAEIFYRAAKRMNSKAGSKSTRDNEIYQQRDYDDYYIASFMDTLPNASMALANNELKIRGIKSFPISQQLNVNVIPDSTNQSIIMYAERSLYLPKGTVTVGKFRFTGENFFMLYQDFSLEMPEIDKIEFAMIDTIRQNDRIVDIDTNWYGGEIKFEAGNMLINDTKNKAGLKKGFDDYPKLNIPLGGVMHFATEFRQDSSYDEKRVYFKIDPIDQDSLNIKLPTFPGTFYSNIFPPFQDKLEPMTQPDNTMGFTHKPPPSGYDLYPDANTVLKQLQENRATVDTAIVALEDLQANLKIKNAHTTFTDRIFMSKDGLSAGGKTTYLSSTLESPEYVFMPDSVIAGNVNIDVKSAKVNGAEFAQAKGRTAELFWYAMEDSMIVSNRNRMADIERAKPTMEPSAFDDKYRGLLFSLYESTKNPMTLRGFLNIGADGLKAEGNLLRNDFTIFSVSQQPLDFDQNKFTATNIDFRINSEKRNPYKFDDGTYYPENPAILQGNFVDVNFDLNKKKTEIKPFAEFADFAALTFPYAQYKTSIKDALWDLNENIITMSGDTTSTFTATNYGSQDYNAKNLHYRGEEAVYDLSKVEMKVNGVPYIYSADAKIIPKEGEVVIEKDAYMQNLEEARLVIDTLNGYHNLFDGTIQIISKQEFEGDATYQFINVQKDTFNIKFDKFQLVEDEKLAKKYGKGKIKRKNIVIPKHTISQGEVKEEDNFDLTSKVKYKGIVKMYAERPNLELDGFIKLELRSGDAYDNWIPYQSDKGDSVNLQIKKEEIYGSQVVTSGLHYEKSSKSLYSTFMSTQRAKDDPHILVASGLLDYNPNLEQFKISPEEKRNGEKFTGNTLVYDDSKNEVRVEGKLDLVDKELAEILNTSGEGTVNPSENTYNFDVFMTCNLPLHSGASAFMQERIVTEIPPKPFVLNKNDALMVTKVAEIIGDKALNNYFEGLKKGAFPITQADKALKVPLVFSSIQLKWSELDKTYYSTGTAQLLNIGQQVINDSIKAFVEIKKLAEGDEFTIYLETTAGLWYYFSMEKGEDEKMQFFTLSSDESFNDAASKSAEIAESGTKDAFVVKFREIYLGEDVTEEIIDEEKKEGTEEKEEKKEEDDDGF